MEYKSRFGSDSRDFWCKWRKSETPLEVKVELITELDYEVGEMIGIWEKGDIKALRELLYRVCDLYCQIPCDLGDASVTNGMVGLISNIIVSLPEDSDLLCAALHAFAILTEYPLSAQALSPAFSAIDSILANSQDDVVIEAALIAIGRFTFQNPSDSIEFPFNIIHQILDEISQKWSRLRPIIFDICCFILQHWTYCHLLSDAIFTGFLIFQNDNINPSNFFHTIRIALFARPKDTVTALEDIRQFYLKISELIRIDDEPLSFATIRLILSLLKRVPKVRAELLGFIDFSDVCRFSVRYEGKSRSAAYRLLAKGIRTQCEIVTIVFESGFGTRFMEDLENGCYSLRIGVLRLISRMLKYGKYDERTSLLVEPNVAEVVLEFLSVEEKKMNLTVVKALFIMVKRGGEHENEISAVILNSGHISLIKGFAENCGELQVHSMKLLERIKG
jgi:hypothetical protein